MAIKRPFDHDIKQNFTLDHLHRQSLKMGLKKADLVPELRKGMVPEVRKRGWCLKLRKGGPLNGIS